jgi:hypothetical protein
VGGIFIGSKDEDMEIFEGLDIFFLFVNNWIQPQITYSVSFQNLPCMGDMIFLCTFMGLSAPSLPENFDTE